MPAATGIRHITHVLSFLIETALLTKNGSFSSERKFLGVWGWDPEQFTEGEIENQVTRSDFGYNEAGLSKAYANSTLNFSCYPQGIGDPDADGEIGCPDGEVAVANAFTYLMQSAMGDATVALSTGSQVATSGNSTTAIVEDDAGRHGASQFAVIEDLLDTTNGVKALVRPILSYATATATLAMALPSALITEIERVGAARANIYGGANVVMNESCDVTLQGDILGNHSTLGFEYLSACFNFSIPEVGNHESPTFSWEGKIGTFSRNIATSRTGISSDRPLSLAGGEFLLAKHGNTAATSLKVLRMGFNWGRTLTPDSEQNNEGFGGWVATDQTAELTLYVHHNASVPTGFTATNYIDLWRSGGVENQFHYMCALGRRIPGRIVALYMLHMHMCKEPRRVQIDGISMQRLVFRFSQGGTEGVAKMWVGQF